MKQNMKYKIAILASLFVLAGCQSSNSTSSSTSSGDGVKYNFEYIKKAVTLDENTSFTGYRLQSQIQSSHQETVYFENTSFVMNKDRTLAHYTSSITRLKGDLNSYNQFETFLIDIYYDATSKYSLKEDGSYQKEVGGVIPSTGLTRYEMDNTYFSEQKIEVSSNVVNFEAKILDQHAASLFQTPVTDFSNGKMKVSVVDHQLSTLDLTYQLQTNTVNTSIAMQYGNNNIVLPVIR